MKRENREMWESFNTFAMSDFESNNEGKVQRTVECRQEKEIEFGMFLEIDEVLVERRRYGKPPTRAPN